MDTKKKRLLGTNEKVFWILDQKTTTHFAVATEIKGITADHVWRDALDKVQQRHPNLSVQISGNDYTEVYLEHVSQCQIPLRIVHLKENESWNSIAEQELSIPFDITKAPLARAVLVQQPDKCIFILLSNHSIGDGMSAALVIRDLLLVISGNSTASLAPICSLDKLAGVSLENSELNVKSVPEYKSSLPTRSGIRVIHHSLSAILTKKIIERSKYEKTTVHSALSAAISIAMREIDEFWHEKPLQILHPLSARKVLDIGDDFGLLINMITLPCNAAPQDSFWDLARSVRFSVAATRNTEWIKGDTMATQQLFNSGFDVETIEQALHQGTEHDILLTNLGQLPFASNFGHLELKSLWGPMVLTPHEASQTIGVATFNGILTLTLTGIKINQNLLNVVEQILEKECNTTLSF
ncbi:condensation domain-containing protein [Flavobacterium sp. MC2016-06]|jgi:hypothetical protein|uniref:condensation domain-containing protein n=1 Tax=Flavobacterium sp. MC2016-06 TaxID=2676308 RepID=UPI0012BAE035|nr:condensation domain-containing protein [Flavobacterium sp. MC2016-06]MBU3857772.1 hypothetical protein [Flavobacterium sp. MC2016-06]